MKELNHNTKKAQRYIELYSKSDIYTINDAYKTRASLRKNAAERTILLNMYQSCGHGYKILSHSHMFFTTGWLSEKEEYLIVDTASETYLIKLPF